MKMSLTIIATVFVFAQSSLACMGGHEMAIKAGDGTELATYNKTKKVLTLKDNVLATYVAKCDSKYAEIGIEDQELDFSSYVQAQADVCFGLAIGKRELDFKLTYSQMTMIARGLPKAGCGGEIRPLN